MGNLRERESVCKTNKEMRRRRETEKVSRQTAIWMDGWMK